jgi:predicted secreted hydrolase
MRPVRRRLLGLPLVLSCARRAAAATPEPAMPEPATPEPAYPAVRPGLALQFPADHGAHPAYRTEWWYLTGWLDAQGAPLGFQVTFFRSRPGVAEALPVASAARQLLFAHAAIADPRIGHLVSDQRAAREAFGLAYARRGDTALRLDDWTLERHADGTYRSAIRAAAFALEIECRPRGPLVLQGEQGYSRKGPSPGEASAYYSWPQLAVSGTLARNGGTVPVRGRAWLDHEWSSQYLSPAAAGWDWVAINLEEGGSLMAFRIRGKDGEPLWAGGSLCRSGGRQDNFAPEAVHFEVLRTWRSARSEAVYPVALRIRTPELAFVVEPLFDDQELDARDSVGTVYWEGAVTARVNGQPIGRGYLELTGYWNRPAV